MAFPKSGRERLRDWIERTKVKDYEAADLIGINPVVLSQYLSGSRTPGLDSAVKIEQVTGVSVESWLLTPESADDEAESVVAGKRKITKR